MGYFIYRNGKNYYVRDDETEEQAISKSSQTETYTAQGYNISYGDENASITGANSKKQQNRLEAQEEGKQRRKSALENVQTNVLQDDGSASYDIAKALTNIQYTLNEGKERIKNLFSDIGNVFTKNKDYAYTDNIKKANEYLEKGNTGDAFDEYGKIINNYFGIERLRDDYDFVTGIDDIQNASQYKKILEIRKENTERLQVINEALHAGCSKEDQVELESELERINTENSWLDNYVEIWRYNCDQKRNYLSQLSTDVTNEKDRYAKESQRIKDEYNGIDATLQSAINITKRAAFDFDLVWNKLYKQINYDAFDADTGVGRFFCDVATDYAEMASPGGMLTKLKIGSQWANDAYLINQYLEGEDVTNRQLLGAALDVGATALSNHIESKLGKVIRNGLSDEEMYKLVNKTGKEIFGDYLKGNIISSMGEGVEEFVQTYAEALMDEEEINNQTFLNALKATAIAFGSTMITSSVGKADSYLFINDVNKKGGVKYVSTTVDGMKDMSGREQQEYKDYNVDNVSQDLKDGKMVLLSNIGSNISTKDAVINNTMLYIFPSEQARNEYYKTLDASKRNTISAVVIDPTENDFNARIEKIYKDGVETLLYSNPAKKKLDTIERRVLADKGLITKSINEINAQITPNEDGTIDGLKLNVSATATMTSKSLRDDLITQVINNKNITNKKEAIKKISDTVFNSLDNKIANRRKVRNVYGKDFVFVSSEFIDNNHYIMAKSQEDIDNNAVVCEIYARDNKIIDTTLEGTTLKLENKDVNLVNTYIKEGLINGDYISKNAKVEDIKTLILNNPDMEKEILEALDYDGMRYDNNGDDTFIMAYNDVDTKKNGVEKIGKMFDSLISKLNETDLKVVENSVYGDKNYSGKFVVDKNSEAYKRLNDSGKFTLDAFSKMNLPRNRDTEDFITITTAISNAFDIPVDFYSKNINDGKTVMTGHPYESGVIGYYQPGSDYIALRLEKDNYNLYNTLIHESLHMMANRAKNKNSDAGERFKNAIIEFSNTIVDANGEILGQKIKQDVLGSYANERPSYDRSEELATFAVGNLFSNDMFIDAFMKAYPEESMILFNELSDIKDVLKDSDVADNNQFVNMINSYLDLGKQYNQRDTGHYSPTRSDIIYDKDTDTDVAKFVSNIINEYGANVDQKIIRREVFKYLYMKNLDLDEDSKNLIADKVVQINDEISNLETEYINENKSLDELLLPNDNRTKSEIASLYHDQQHQLRKISKLLDTYNNKLCELYDLYDKYDINKEFKSGNTSMGEVMSDDMKNFFKDSKYINENGDIIDIFHTMTHRDPEFDRFNPKNAWDGFNDGDIKVAFTTDNEFMSSTYALGQKVESSSGYERITDNIESLTHAVNNYVDYLKEHGHDSDIYTTLPNEVTCVVTIKDGKLVLINEDNNISINITNDILTTFPNIVDDIRKGITNKSYDTYANNDEETQYGSYQYHLLPNIKRPYVIPQYGNRNFNTINKMYSSVKNGITKLLHTDSLLSSVRLSYQKHDNSYLYLSIIDSTKVINREYGLNLDPTLISNDILSHIDYNPSWISSDGVNYTTKTKQIIIRAFKNELKRLNDEIYVADKNPNHAHGWAGTTNQVVYHVLELNKHLDNKFDSIIIKQIYDYGTSVDNATTGDVIIGLKANVFKSNTNMHPSNDDSFHYNKEYAFTSRTNSMTDNSNVANITGNKLLSNTKVNTNLNVFGDQIDIAKKSKSTIVNDARKKNYTISKEDYLRIMGSKKTENVSINTWKQGDSGIRVQIPNIMKKNLITQTIDGQEIIVGVKDIDATDLVPVAEDVQKISNDEIKKALNIKTEKQLQNSYDLGSTEVITIGGESYFMDKQNISAENWAWLANSSSPINMKEFKNNREYLRARASNWAKQAYSTIFAKGAPIEEIANRIGDAKTKFYEMQFRHSMTIANYHFNDNCDFIDGTTSNITPLGKVQKTLKDMGKLDDFAEWYQLKYNAELIERPFKGEQYRIRKENYDETISKIKEIESRNPDFNFEAYADYIRKYNDYQLDVRLKSGLITEGNYNNLKKSGYKYYMPMYAKKDFKKSNGRYSQIDNDLIIGQNIKDLVKEKGSYQEEPLGLFESYLKRQQELDSAVTKNELIKNMTIDENKSYYGDGKGIVKYYVDGVELNGILDTQITSAIGYNPEERKLDRVLNSKLGKFVKLTNNIHMKFQVGSTNALDIPLNIVFTLKNLRLDMETAYFNPNANLNFGEYLYSRKLAYENIFNNSQYAKELEAMGILDTLDGSSSKLRRVLHNLENIPKMATYIDEISKGRTKWEAALMASDANIDPTRGGWFTKKISGNVVTYLNTSIQSVDKLYNTFKHAATGSPTTTQVDFEGGADIPEEIFKLIAKFGLLFTPKLINQIMNLDNEYYNNVLSNADKATHYYIPLDENGSKMLKVSAGREHVLFDTLVMWATNMINFKDKKDFKATVMEAATQIMPGPVQDALLGMTGDDGNKGHNGPVTTFITSMLPQGLANIERLISNEDYYGNAIYDEDGNFTDKIKSIFIYELGTFGLAGKEIQKLIKEKDKAETQGREPDYLETAAKATGVYTNQQSQKEYQEYIEKWKEIENYYTNKKDEELTLYERIEKKYFLSKNAEVNNYVSILSDSLNTYEIKQDIQDTINSIKDETYNNYQKYDIIKSSRKQGYVVVFADRVFYLDEKGNLTNITNKSNRYKYY